MDYGLHSLIITVNTELIETTSQGGINSDSTDEILDILSLTINEFDSISGFEISTIYRTIPSFVITISYQDPNFYDLDIFEEIINHLLLNEEFTDVEKNYISSTQ